MFLLMISIFVAGIILVALEDKLGVNKTATALMMAVVLWIIVAMGADIRGPFVEHLGDVSETLFFVMGAMAIVELIDIYGGFNLITDSIKTTNKRKMLWILSFLTFFLSAVLDNLATGIVMIAMLRKIIPHRPERIIFACMVIIAANAGGAFSPIGDVTTILLWTGGNLTPIHQIAQLFLPALACLIVPLCLVTRFFKKDASWEGMPSPTVDLDRPQVSKTVRIVVLILGVSTMALVPVFNEWSTLPPFMRVIMGLSIMWIYTDIISRKWRKTHFGEEPPVRVPQILPRIDLSTILFFLGILMSVAALDTSGQLKAVSDFFNSNIDNELSISFIIGIISSFVDNVALVAATMSMYSVDPASAMFMVDGGFWTFLAYCAVTGGSLLIIGSATGVTVMGMEKISFMYYLKRFSLLALAGYLAGAGVYLLLT